MSGRSRGHLCSAVPGTPPPSSSLAIHYRCQTAHYCDKDCQREHWQKVHKERCKYVRGDRELEVGVHRHLAARCARCKGGPQTWGCHLEKNKEFWDRPLTTFRGRDGELYDAPLAVPIGELTGMFTSRLEHQVCLPMAQVTNHPARCRSSRQSYTRCTSPATSWPHQKHSLTWWIRCSL